HEPRVGALRNVAGEDQALLGFVDREDRANDAGLAIDRADRQRKEQTGGGEVFRVIAEIALIELERGFSIELVEHVARGFRDQPLGAERIPSSERSTADAQAIAVKTEDCDHTRPRTFAREHERLLEALAIAGKPAGYSHARRQLL